MQKFNNSFPYFSLVFTGSVLFIGTFGNLIAFGTFIFLMYLGFYISPAIILILLLIKFFTKGEEDKYINYSLYINLGAVLIGLSMIY